MALTFVHHEVEVIAKSFDPYNLLFCVPVFFQMDSVERVQALCKPFDRIFDRSIHQILPQMNVQYELLDSSAQAKKESVQSRPTELVFNDLKSAELESLILSAAPFVALRVGQNL